MTDTPLARFQDPLRELFQFDCADLDFGIYLILNHKRDVIYVNGDSSIDGAQSLDCEFKRRMFEEVAA